MKKIILSSVSITMIMNINAAMAMTEPKRVDATEIGDDKIVSVEWNAAGIININLARGQSSIVELPKGFKVDSLMPSENDLMTNYVPEDSPGNNAANVDRSNPDAKKNKACMETSNLRLCVKRDRFLMIKPLTDLDKQSFPLLVLQEIPKAKKDKEIEHIVVFQISTVLGDRTPYYGVRVTLPAPAVVTPPAVVARARRPIVRHTETAIEPITSQSPPVINNKYIIQGSEDLIGK